MDTFTYLLLTKNNFNENSLDEFIRHQEVKECYRKNSNNEYVLVKNEYVEDWDLNKRRELAKYIINKIKNKSFAYGAFSENNLVGFILVSNELFGSNKEYLELLLFHISEPHRAKGIGKKLFELASNKTKTLGAKKLYISAHSSKESIEVYKRLGCVNAKEKNQVIADNEPYDIQMEYVIY